jgi:hypothetical protein
MPPISLGDYCQWSAECERLADTAVSSDIRDTMLHLAARWRALVEEEELNGRRDSTGRSWRSNQNGS